VSIFELAAAFLPPEVEPKSFFCIPQATRKLLTGFFFSPFPVLSVKGGRLQLRISFYTIVLSSAIIFLDET